MFAQHIRMDMLGIHLQLPADQTAQTRCIERGP
jgi:hypothetical protein